jgi:uncharacterized protein (DUF885 family)
VVLGREEFTRRLRLYTDSDLTPEQLAEMSLKEIQKVRGLISQVCEDSIREAYPEQKFTEDLEELVNKALGDMEKIILQASRNTFDSGKNWPRKPRTS